jgi:hypothetical protein
VAIDRHRISPFVMVRPSESTSLSDGVVVEATVIARLLGLKLLRVKAHVTLLPADLEQITYVDTPSPPQQVDRPAEGGGNLRDAAQLLAHASRTRHDAERIWLTRQNRSAP